MQPYPGVAPTCDWCSLMALWNWVLRDICKASAARTAFIHLGVNPGFGQCLTLSRWSFLVVALLCLVYPHPIWL